MSYTGWRLTDSSRTALLERFPARFPDIIAHHITLSTKGDTAPEHATIEVVGYAVDESGLEALVVSVNGSTLRRDAGRHYHITWSIDRVAGFKPVDSNAVIKNGFTIFDESIPIETDAFWVDDHRVEHIRIND